MDFDAQAESISDRLTIRDWIKYQWMAYKLKNMTAQQLRMRLVILRMAIKEWRKRGHKPTVHMITQQKLLHAALRPKLRAQKEQMDWDDETVVVGLKPIKLDKEMMGMGGNKRKGT